MDEAIFKKQFINDFKGEMQQLGIDCEVYQNKSQRRSTLDTIFLGPGCWAMLEFKEDEKSPHQPNQDYYVEKLNNMCYATFVYPQNANKVMEDLIGLFIFADKEGVI